MIVKARTAALCGAVVLAWALPSFGWPFAIAALPFVVGVCMAVWRLAVNP